MNRPGPLGVESNKMRLVGTFGCLWLVLQTGTFCACGQDAIELDIGELGEMVESAQEWAEENLDEEVLASLAGSGPRAGGKIPEASFRINSKADYVLDLAALKDAAKFDSAIARRAR